MEDFDRVFAIGHVRVLDWEYSKKKKGAEKTWNWCYERLLMLSNHHRKKKNSARAFFFDMSVHGPAAKG